MCMIDAGERYEVCSTAYRTARKEHYCGECGRIIRRGEQYRYDTGLYEGHWNSHHTCQHCGVAMRWLGDNCGGWMFESVLSDIEGHVFEYPRLAFGLLRLLCGMRRQWSRFDGAGLMSLPGMPRGIREVVEA